MAHGDYNCCAICNAKMDYNGSDPRTKEDICIKCLKNLRAEDINVLDPEEFITWVEKQTPESLKPVLERLGFYFCYYTNPVDEAVNRIMGGAILK